MAKKKSKKKHHKTAKDIGSDVKQGLGEGNIKNIGIMLASVVLLQIVEAAIERLLQKLPSHTPSTATAENSQSSGDNQELSHPIVQPIDSSVLTLGSETGMSQLNSRDVAEALRASVRDLAPSLDDVVTMLKSGTWHSMHQAVGTAGSTTKTAVEGVVSGAKTLIDRLHPSETDAPSKAGKKKRKKKK